MSEIRKQIHNKLSLLGKDITNTHLSELQNRKDLEKRVIRTDLLDFDYSKQRINEKAIDYLLEIPNLINLKDNEFKDLINWMYLKTTKNGASLTASTLITADPHTSNSPSLMQRLN